MIKSASKRTIEPALLLAEKLSAKFDSNAGENGNVYFEWSSTMQVTQLMQIAAGRRAYVVLPHGWVVVVFAETKEQAHQEVCRQLGDLAAEKQDV
jgi:hypothetical protein